MKYIISILLLCSVFLQASDTDKEKSLTDQIKDFRFHDTFVQPFFDMTDSIEKDLKPHAKALYNDVEKATKKTYKQSSKAVKSWYKNDVEPEMQHAKDYIQTQIEKIAK